MGRQRLNETDRSLPRPIRARLLAAQLGRNFSETISALIRFADDVEAVARHFSGQDVDPEPPKFEPNVICKSESEPITVDLPSNATVIDDMVSRGVLAPAVIETARGVRLVYASPGFARYLSAVCGEEQERDDFRC
jgi:hypothetical protein